MKRRSFLIADYDPFIVIPMNIILDKLSLRGPKVGDKWGPKVGDYAVVLHKGILYPAIVGDAGPTFKVGEASLRMARQIDKKSSSYWRPVSDLSVTYICFPGTAKKPHRPPNYEEFRETCQGLLERLVALKREWNFSAGRILFRCWMNLRSLLLNKTVNPPKRTQLRPRLENSFCGKTRTRTSLESRRRLLSHRDVATPGD